MKLTFKTGCVVCVLAFTIICLFTILAHEEHHYQDRVVLREAIQDKIRLKQELRNVDVHFSGDGHIYINGGVPDAETLILLHSLISSVFGTQWIQDRYLSVNVSVAGTEKKL